MMFIMKKEIVMTTGEYKYDFITIQWLKKLFEQKEINHASAWCSIRKKQNLDFL